MDRWKPLVVLGTAMFLMVLDTSVMNVSISQLVEDFDTEVTAIQATITLYTLVMAAFMITGGKLGDLWGRRRMFQIGLIVYGVGSAITSIAPVLWVLNLGWSVIEGLGAALVLPALAALVGGNYTGRDRAGRLRRDRRPGRRRHCGRTAPRRVGDHVPDLAVGIRR
jgi:MFS family permease